MQKSFEEKKPNSDRKNNFSFNLSSKDDNRMIDTLKSDIEKLLCKLSESEGISNNLKENNE